MIGFPGDHLLVVLMVKHLLAMQKTWVRSLSRDDLLEKEMATHSNILAGKPHGQRSSRGFKKLDPTEELTHSPARSEEGTGRYF